MAEEINRLYVIYGYDDPAEAPILLSTSSPKFAREWVKDYDAVCYSYRTDDRLNLIDERRENFDA